MAVILLWFNPFIWLLRKEVEKNLEYQTDDILVRSKSEEKECYQLNLVKIASYTQPLSITTNYNQSLIKQRIIKMNSKKSNNFSYWKYAFTAPLKFAILLVINKPNTALANTLEGVSPNQNEVEHNTALPFPNTIESSEALSTAIAIDNTASSSSVSEFYKNENHNYVQENNAPRSADTDSNCKALLKAIRSQDISLIKSLISKSEVNCTEANPEYEETKSPDGEITYRRSHARTPVTAAAYTGNLEIGKLLMQAGAEIHNNPNHDMSALGEAAYSGHQDFATI
ncbi:MAG: hypothetical protein ACI9FN_002036 [Saprospiraceae bacterium]|jgi:hypothetical protein